MSPFLRNLDSLSVQDRQSDVAGSPVLHSAVARLNRVWSDLADLNLEDLFNRSVQAQPIHETLVRLDDAIGKIEEIVKDLEEVKAEG